MPSAPIAALSARSVETWYRGIWGLGLTVATSLLIAVPSLARDGPGFARGAAIVVLVVCGLLRLGGLDGQTAHRTRLMNGLSIAAELDDDGL